jgi:hypothetical protein
MKTHRFLLAVCWFNLLADSGVVAHLVALPKAQRPKIIVVEATLLRLVCPA